MIGKLFKGFIISNITNASKLINSLIIEINGNFSLLTHLTIAIVKIDYLIKLIITGTISVACNND